MKFCFSGIIPCKGPLDTFKSRPKTYDYCGIITTCNLFRITCTILIRPFVNINIMIIAALMIISPHSSWEEKRWTIQLDYSIIGRDYMLLLSFQMMFLLFSHREVNAAFTSACFLLTFHPAPRSLKVLLASLKKHFLSSFSFVKGTDTFSFLVSRLIQACSTWAQTRSIRSVENNENNTLEEMFSTFCFCHLIIIVGGPHFQRQVLYASWFLSDRWKGSGDTIHTLLWLICVHKISIHHAKTDPNMQ